MEELWGLPVSRVSARRAADILSVAGHGRTMARRILATGLAGEPVRERGACWYEEERVLQLLERPLVDLTQLPEPCDRFLLLQRVRPGSHRDEWDRLSPVGFGSSIRLSPALILDGYLALIRTSCGYVVDGREIIARRPDGPLALRLVTRPPGAWFERFNGRRMTSPPGHHWYLWSSPSS